MTISTRYLAAVAAVTALAGGGAVPASAAFDARECATARFDLRWERLSVKDTGFPESHDPYLQHESDGYIAYSDGTYKDYEDYPSRGWTLVREGVGLTGTEPVYDADYNEIGTRSFQHRYSSYARVDPTFDIAGLATHERARVMRMRHLWIASRRQVNAYMRANRDSERRWLIRRGRAFLASARASERRLADAIAAPTDVAVVDAATAQLDRLEDTVLNFDLKMPLASLEACYR